MTVNSLITRLGVPADIDTLAGIRRLVNQRASETRHLDFKQQLNNVDDLAEDLSALANVGGGVLVIGIGTDKADCAASLHEQDLHLVEQQTVQAARDGIDEPLRIETMIVPSDADPVRGFLVIVVPPSDRTPHITVKKGRVLHRVGTHNKPMTRRELGAAFAAAGDLFAIEFGLTRGYGGMAVICELVDSVGGMHNTIKVANTGTIPALDISIDSTTSKILWDKDAEGTPDEPRNLPGLFDRQNYVLDPPYLPIRSLPSGSDVILRCWREWGNPQQDVLQVTWRTPDGQVHRNEQSWSWTPRRSSLMPKVTASSPRSVSVSVSLNWQRRGEAVAYFPASWEQISFFWPTNFVSTRPGLYRITVMDTDFRLIYIGESDRLCRRLGDYTRIYHSKPDSTPSRLTFLIRRALVRGHPVYLDTASTGRIIIGSGERRLEMGQKAQRLLAEAAAVLQEEDLAGDDDNAWVLNKHLDDKRYREDY